MDCGGQLDDDDKRTNIQKIADLFEQQILDALNEKECSGLKLQQARQYLKDQGYQSVTRPAGVLPGLQAAVEEKESRVLPFPKIVTDASS